MRVYLAAAALLLLPLAGCSDESVSVNAGACGAALQASAATISALGAAAEGDQDEFERSMRQVEEHAEHLANNSSGPLADLGSELVGLSRRSLDEGEVPSGDARDTLVRASSSLLDLCRDHD